MNMSNTYNTAIINKFNDDGKEIRYTCDNEEELIKHFNSTDTRITEIINEEGQQIKPVFKVEFRKNYNPETSTKRIIKEINKLFKNKKAIYFKIHKL